MCGELGSNILSNESWHLLKFERLAYVSEIWLAMIHKHSSTSFWEGPFNFFNHAFPLFCVLIRKTSFSITLLPPLNMIFQSLSVKGLNVLGPHVWQSHFFFFRNLDFGKETQRRKVVVVVSQYRHINDACSWLKAVRIQEPLYLRLPSFIRDIQHPYTVKLVFAFVQICESNYSLKPHSDGQWHHSSVEGPEQCWLSLSFAARPGYKCNSQLWTKTSSSTTMPGMEASNNLSRMMGWRPEQTIGNWVQKKSTVEIAPGWEVCTAFY